MTRDGDNLVLETSNGETAIVEGYFSAEPSPLLQSADGATLTPNLVDAFSRSPLEFAANDSASDESPVGAVEEVKGNGLKGRITDADVQAFTRAVMGGAVQTSAIASGQTVCDRRADGDLKHRRP